MPNGFHFPDEDESPARSLISIPDSPEQFRPPRPADAITEAANYLRTPSGWGLANPYLKAMSGEAPTIQGNFRWDRAAMVLEIQRDCRDNGFALLGALNAKDLDHALYFGNKRNTGIALADLNKQNRQLRIESRLPRN